MSRLLTEEEIIQLITAEQKRQGVPDKYNFPEAIALSAPYDRVLIKAQRDLTHKETLKAVGELLEDKCLIVDPVTHEPEGYWIDLADGNKLKRGEMPEEVK